jgi:hypothetical protein
MNANFDDLIADLIADLIDDLIDDLIAVIVKVMQQTPVVEQNHLNRYIGWASLAKEKNDRARAACFIQSDERDKS